MALKHQRKGAKCRGCGGPVSYWSKSGYCKKKACYSQIRYEGRFCECKTNVIVFFQDKHFRCTVCKKRVSWRFF